MRPQLRVPLTSDTGDDRKRNCSFRNPKDPPRCWTRFTWRCTKCKKLEEEQEGAADHLRWRRQSQPLLAEGSDNLVRESDVLIYSIGVFGGGTAGRGRRSGLARHISEQTGGRLFEANAVELPDIAQKIGIELRNRYILGYSPQSQARDGKYHRITVKVVPPRGLPKLRAHWRMGYNAPVE